MVKHGLPSTLALAMTGLRMAGVAGFLLLGAASAHATDAPDKSKAPAKPALTAESLGDAFITQNSLRIYLSRPAAISLHNARGQTLFQLESARPTEVLPLAGLPTGFLYLTLRSGQLELTKKLVYSGK